LNKSVVGSVAKAACTSILLLVSAQAFSIPMKGSLGVAGAIERIDYAAEEVFFASPGWGEVKAADGEFLDDFEVEQAGPLGNDGSWLNYYSFGASSLAGDVLWSFDKDYDGSIDLWFELGYFYSREFDALAGTMEVLGKGMLTDGIEKVESYWSFNATHKGGSIAFSSAFAVPEPTTLLLFTLGLVCLLVFRNQQVVHFRKELL
jgi:hypothetical protein